MSDDGIIRKRPTDGIWIRFLVLVPVIIIMIFACRAYIHSVGSTYESWTPLYSKVDFSSTKIDDVVISNTDVVKAVAIEHGADKSVCVVLRSVSDGTANVSIPVGDSGHSWSLRVTDGVIVVDGVNFTGWESIHICICLCLGLLTLLFASVVVKLFRRSWFDHEMIACGGGFLFCFFQFLLFTFFLLRGSFQNFCDMAYEICNAASLFVAISLLPMGIMALLVSISNISLIRHEGKRPTNMLGIAISIVWLIAIFIWLHWWSFGIDHRISLEVVLIVDAVISVAIAFGESLLVSTIFCSWAASRHVPKRNASYLIILGCGLREDGTPSPLLAGRVDRAIEFDATRVSAGDAPTTFVPSGGQGADEVVSEAQSMATYIEGKGIDQARIVLEDQSTSTRENMALSRKAIESHAKRDAGEVSVAFSTTNYHVFRGYVCAHEANMYVEGMGAKTKSYFWPNAFLREFAGLLASQWKTILQTYLLTAIIYALASYALTVYY